MGWREGGLFLFLMVNLLLFKIFFIIYLFLLRWVFAAGHGFPLVAATVSALGLLITVVPIVAEHGLKACRFNRCGSWP